MSYISSNANRFYVALESAYGSLAAITASARIPALKLAVTQAYDAGERKDKTGSRTFAGLPAGGRRRTAFDLKTYQTTWQQGSAAPSYGPLFQAALGAAPLTFSGGTVASMSGSRLGFAAPHGLTAGQAIASGGEIRFVSAIADPSTVVLNAPFTVVPAAGASISQAVTYGLATELPSVSIFDYWSPSTATQRLLPGAAVDQMTISVDCAYHEFQFSGMAQDVIDSSSFSSGAASLSSFPAEPALGAFDYSIVPGCLGQAWLGTPASEFFTLTSASVVLKNALDMRTCEFGSNVPRAVSPGMRNVSVALELYAQDDSATQGLYQAARQQSPISVMFQLGDASGLLMGVNLKSVIPEVPEFADDKNRLQWKFRPSRAQGTVNDEITVAFA
jgi:hypothetical protein